LGELEKRGMGRNNGKPGEDDMSEKMKKLKPRERKFLESYAQTGNHAEAYLASGYKVNSWEVARVNGYRLLRRLFETMDYRQTMDNVGLDDLRLAEILKALGKHEDPKIRVPAVNIATKCRGWQRDNIEIGAGAQILILQSRPQDAIDQAKDAIMLDEHNKEMKPKGLLR
jgi:hypothetical protein